MNISTIGSSDAMDVMSTARTPVKQQEHSTTKSSPDPSNAAAADPNKKIQTDPLTKDSEKNGNAQTPPSSKEEIEQMANELNERMDDLQTSLGFSVSEDLDNQVIVQIRDRKTNEVIRQIPTEEVQKIKEKMTELTGLLLDHRV